MQRKRRLAGLISAAIVIAASALAVTSTAAAKEAGDWLIRGRVIAVVPDESSKITPIGGAAKVGNEVTAELDFSYFLTDHVAAELILATSKHSVSATGTAIGDIDLGHVWALPPTLTLQYHFNPKGQLSPYLGAGINLTLFHSVNTGPVVADVNYGTSFGVALQAGFDYRISKRLYFNVDVKRLWLNTNVKIDAGALGMVTADVDINPFIIGTGVGIVF